MTQRVWITGVGAATPLGSDFATFAENLLGGKSGVVARSLVPQGLGPAGTADPELHGAGAGRRRLG